MPTHWRQLIDSEYLTAGDLMLPDGRYWEGDVEIVKWRGGQVSNGDENGKKKRKWFVSFVPRSACPDHIRDRIMEKEYGGNVTNSKVLESITGSPHVEKWLGAWVRIFVTKVRSQQGRVDAIRFRPEAPARTEVARGSGPADRGARPSSPAARPARGDDIPPIGDDQAPRGGRAG